MKSFFYKINIKDKCRIYNKWLIITAMSFVFLFLESCMPPKDLTTDRRVSRQNIQFSNNFSSGLVHNNSKKKKNKEIANPNSKNQTNNNEIFSTDFDNSSITTFEEKILKANSAINNSNNNSISNKEVKSSKKLPSLKEQIDELNKNQTEMEEKIEEIKGDVSELKNTLENISRESSSDFTYKKNSSNSDIAGLSSSNSNRTFILESNETLANKESSSNSNVNFSNSKEKVSANNTTVTTQKKHRVQKIAEKKEELNIKEQQIETTATPSATTTNNIITTNNNTNNNSINSSTSGGDFSEVIDKIAKGEIATATKILNTKLKISKEPSEIANCFYWLGECSFKQKDYAKAVANYKASIKSSIDKKDVAQAKIAESYMRAGKNAEAKAAYQALLDNYPRSSFSAKAKKMLQQL